MRARSSDGARDGLDNHTWQNLAIAIAIGKADSVPLGAMYTKLVGGRPKRVPSGMISEARREAALRVP